jgi:aquaporin Z
MIKYIVEFVGTLIFLSVILSQGQAVPIAIALAAVIFFGGAISGGHYNPAVSVMMYLNNNLADSDLILYIISQVMGGVVALSIFKTYVEVLKK